MTTYTVIGVDCDDDDLHFASVNLDSEESVLRQLSRLREYGYKEIIVITSKAGYTRVDNFDSNGELIPSGPIG